MKKSVNIPMTVDAVVDDLCAKTVENAKLRGALRYALELCILIDRYGADDNDREEIKKLRKEFGL